MRSTANISHANYRLKSWKRDNFQFLAWLTFPFCDTKYPLPLMSWPFSVVTPPAIAFTACSSVLSIDFFSCHPSNDFVSYEHRESDEYDPWESIKLTHLGDWINLRSVCTFTAMTRFNDVTQSTSPRGKSSKVNEFLPLCARNSQFRSSRRRENCVKIVFRAFGQFSEGVASERLRWK